MSKHYIIQDENHGGWCVWVTLYHGDRRREHVCISTHGTRESAKRWAALNL